MEYKKVLEECRVRAALYRKADAIWNLTHEEQCYSAISNLLSKVEELENSNSQLDGIVDSLMKSNQRFAEELKAHNESDLAKAHDALSAEWEKEKKRADELEEYLKLYEEILKKYQFEIVPKYKNLLCKVIEILKEN